MKKLWHLEDPDTENKGWHPVELHATDAAHALEVDPKHWSAEKPERPDDQGVLNESGPFVPAVKTGDEA